MSSKMSWGRGCHGDGELMDVCGLHCRPITTFLPLAIVLGVSIFKEAMEDMRRYQADREVNARACLVLDPAAGAWQTRRWRDVKARLPLLVPGMTRPSAEALGDSQPVFVLPLMRGAIACECM